MNFTQIEVLDKKKFITTLFGVFEESLHDRISDLLTHLIKNCYTDIGTTRVIKLDFDNLHWDKNSNTSYWGRVTLEIGISKKNFF